MEPARPLTHVSDDELLRRLVEILGQSRHTEADLVAHIGEADARRLYAREASPSMFAYCTERLHLSEAEAYLRIAAARAAREHPVLLEMLTDGRLHLTAIAKLAPHLTPENRDRLLAPATHRTKREVEDLVAEAAPRPDVPTIVRRLPERRTGNPAPRAAQGPPDLAATSALERRPDGVALLGPQLRLDAVVPSRPGMDTVAPGPDGVHPPAVRATVRPLAPGRYSVQFTASAALCEKLERLQALMRSSVPDGNLAAIIEDAVTEKLERMEARRFARTKAPRKGLAESRTGRSSRYIPAAVRRAVYRRDEGRCRFVDAQGQRCPERHRLEFHHRRPFALGGVHTPEGICLLCRAHNQYVAEIDFGRAAMARHRRSSAGPPGLPLLA